MRSFLTELEQELPGLEEVEKKLAEEINSPAETMQKLARYILLNKGKRLRPLLVLLSASFYPANREAVLDAAAAVEMIHTASLVHDDIIDEAGKRRGYATINSIRGNHAAVLVGDFLFARAFGVLSRYARLGLVEKVTEAIRLMCEGELQQSDAAFHWEKTEENYFEQVRKKTGYLLSVCCELGGKLSGMPAGEVDYIKNYGLQLGCAFQIVDDLLDCISRPEDIGKPVGLDLRQGVLTLPLIYLLSDRKYGPHLQRLLSIVKEGRYSSAIMHRIQILVEEGGGVKQAYAEAQRRVDLAKISLEPFEGQKGKKILEQVADRVLDRVSTV